MFVSAAAGARRINSTYMVPQFVQYADALFAGLGDRVKHWIVFNEVSRETHTPALMSPLVCPRIIEDHFVTHAHPSRLL